MKNLCLTLVILFFSCTLLFAQKEIHQTIYFDFGSSDLTKSELRKLDSLVIALEPYTNYKIALTGHTDSVGETGDNYLLSNDRSNTVRFYLATKDIADDKITMVNYGEDTPVDFTPTPEGCAHNRRVEITVTFKPPVPIATPITEVADPNANSGGGGSGEPQTITLPNGPSIAGGYGFNVIRNTAQMEALNLTTQTVGGEPLVSNVMVCITSSRADSGDKTPVKILVPASFNPYCKFPDVQLYDSQNDSLDGNQVKWMPLLFPDFKPVVVGGIDYFEWTITPGTPVPSCKNGDCPKTGALTANLKLPTKKYEMVSVSVIYPDANALLRGHAVEKNLWQFKYFSNDSISSPHIKVVVKDKKGQLHTADVIMRDLKKNRKGELMLKKKMFMKKES